MFEMYNNFESKAKERMPSSLKSFFKALYDTFQKIYKNVTGKSLMPEGLASAYSSFVENSNAQSDSTILKQAGNEVSNDVVYAGNNEEAKFALEKYRNKDIVNLNDGITARISSTGINKMISNVAVMKSISNGFSRQEHTTAVANVIMLFKNGRIISTSDDIKGSPDILSIKRYATRVSFYPSERTGTAVVLLKESKNNGNRIYTLELQEIKKEPYGQGGELKKQLNHTKDSIVNLPSEPTEVNANGERIEAFDDILFQVDPDYSPNKVGTGYKLFEQDTRDKKLYPLFIGAKEETPMGKWIVAENIPTKGFSKRPGWHIGSSLPDAPWLKGYSAENPKGVFKSKRGKNFKRVWAEVSYPMDIDYQKELDEKGIKDIKDHIPEGGYYRFREANGVWIIAGALKVDRILSEADREAVFEKAGYDEQKTWESHPSYASRKKHYIEKHGDLLKQLNSTPEATIAREFSSDRNASQRYTFVYFTEKDT